MIGKKKAGRNRGSRWRLACAVTLCFLTLGLDGATAADTPERPNVLFIISDDLCTALSGFGHPTCETPNLDNLAERGMRFERAYCQYPVCGPSRASLMTGLYPQAIGTMSNRKSKFREKHKDLVTLPQLFRQNGYVTARVSKIYHMGIPGEILAGTAHYDDPASWTEAHNIKGPEHNAPGSKEDLCPKIKGQGRDFVKVEAEGDDLAHADGMAAEKAIALLGQHKDKPFFLALGMVRPHVPLVAPSEYFEPYPAESMALAHVPEGDLDDVPEAAQSQTNERKYGMSEDQQLKTLGAYYASVAYMDAQVGKVLDELDRLGLRDKTIVVFTSDHGYNLGQHTCWQKLSLWEDSTRVPFIVSVPWLETHGGASERVVELIDLYPTLAELCGLTPPSNLHGQSFAKLLEEPMSETWADRVAYTISRAGGESLRTERWRYNLWKDGKAGEELYDHDNDPGEFINLAGRPEYATTVRRLKRRLKALKAKSRHIAGASAGVPADLKSRGHAHAAPGREQRVAWWREARFGMFIHWGVYSIPAGTWNGERVAGVGEWIMNRAKIPVPRYEKLADAFDPVRFNAEQWVKVAKAAGQKYMVITAKHHDGFAMFDSSHPYNIVDATPFKRDVIGELAEACREYDLRLGFYYSQSQDWHHPGGAGNKWYTFPEEQTFRQYLDNKVKPQLRELLTQYGPVALIWFDTPIGMTPEQSLELRDYVLELQPDCIVSGRIGNDMGDYGSLRDNQLPYGAIPGDWEVPATMNHTWGYKSYDDNWKSTPLLIDSLALCASKGVNYLLNVGPTAEGEIPGPSVERLRAVGVWLAMYGEAIYGTRRSPFAEEPSWGYVTSRPAVDSGGVERLYLMVRSKDWPEDGLLRLRGARGEVEHARFLHAPAAALSTEEADGDPSTLLINVPPLRPTRSCQLLS